MRSIETRQIGDAVVAVHSQAMDRLEDRDWEQFLRLLDTQTKEGRIRVIVFTSKSAPSPQQRKKLFQILDKLERKDILISVFTKGLMPRMAIRAIAILGVDIKAFSLTQFDDVTKRMKVTIRQAAVIKRFAQEYDYRFDMR